MLIKLHKLTEDNFYAGEDLLIKQGEAVPHGYTNIPIPDGLYKAKLVENEWKEGLSQKEVEALKNIAPPISDTEALGQQMTERESEAIVQGQQITDLEIESMINGQQMTDFEIRLLELEAMRNV